MKIELTGNGFTLRNWQLTDAPALQKHADNVKVASTLPDHFPSPYTIANANFFISLKVNDDPITSFAIVINGETCGVIGIDNFGEDKPLIGYWLSDEHWGKGVTTEAVMLFTQYALNTLRIAQLYAHVAGKNVASMRVLEKAGFTKTNILKDDLTLRGEIFDRHVYMHTA